MTTMFQSKARACKVFKGYTIAADNCSSIDFGRAVFLYKKTTAPPDKYCKSALLLVFAFLSLDLSFELYFFYCSSIPNLVDLLQRLKGDWRPLTYLILFGGLRLLTMESTHLN